MQRGTGERPDVFSYHDYREFLKDWTGYLKSTKKIRSVRALSSEADLNATHLGLILIGQTKMTAFVMGKLKPLLRLKDAEFAHFENLVAVSDAEDPAKRKTSLQKIRKRLIRKKVNVEEMETYQYLTKWYYVAIRELVDLPDFSLDPKWIQKKLLVSIPISEIKKAIEFLKEHRFISDNGSEKVSLTKKMEGVDRGFFKVALHDLHNQLYELASHALYNVPSEERMLKGHTVAVSENQREAAQKILDEALTKIADLTSESNRSDAVYYFGVLGIPLAQSNKKSRGAA